MYILITERPLKIIRGSTDALEIPRAAVLRATAAVEQAFGLARMPDSGEKPRRLRADIISALTADAGDPDDVLASWVAGNTPIGIKAKIPTRGIFPKAADVCPLHPTSLDDAEAMSCSTEICGNYTSVDENACDTSTELKKEREKGFLMWDTSKTRLQAKVGKLVLSRVGAIVTTKPG